MKHHIKPKLLISFRHLQGGQYGTLDVSSRKSGSLELALGGDYVWLTREQWLALRRVGDGLFGIAEGTVLVEARVEETRIEEEDGDVEVDERAEERIVVEPPPPAAARRRRRA
jgi:hypothetical protein